MRVLAETGSRSRLTKKKKTTEEEEDAEGKKKSRSRG